MAVLLIGALLLVYLSAEVLQAWAVHEHNESEQGRLGRPHWADPPQVGPLG